MQQVPLDLQFPTPFGFDVFLIGGNLEAFSCLRDWACSPQREQALYLYGDTGVGKTHLLHACVASSQTAGLTSRYIDASQESLDGISQRYDLLAIDHIDSLSLDAQEQLFRLYNAQRESGGACLCAGRHAPTGMNLRADLQTRLAWGLSFPILPPDDADKVTLLRHRALQRGYPVTEDVCRYLVTHSQRDLASLTSLLDQLDRFALASKRPISIILAREWLRGHRPQ